MNNSKENIVIGGIYKHVDGPTYRVDKVGLDATGYEEIGKIGKTVTYTQLEDGEKFPAGTEWHRKVENFLGVTEVQGEVRKIFELIMDES